jgi:hypothetical protein
MLMNSVDIEREFPELQPEVMEIVVELQNLILHKYPVTEVTSDGENIGFGFGSGYKDLVYVISPQRAHVKIGIVNGAPLEDPNRLMQGKGKVHRHMKLHHDEEVQNPDLEDLMLRALNVAQERHQKGG